MTDHPKCQTCKHWEAPIDNEYDIVRFAMGHCRAVPHTADMTKWNDDYDRQILLPEYENSMAAAEDGSGYHAALITRPEYYCPMHSDLVPL